MYNKGIVERLSNGNLQIQQFSFHQQPAESKNRLLILSARPLKNPDLINYVISRGIKKETADKYCEEVDFQIDSKHYNAIGFQNRSGGYELRNRWFKGSSSPKDITIINNHAPKLCVSEGFMDFLSIQQLKDEKFKSLADQSNFLILNSVSFIKRSIPIIQSHPEVILFLDNDPAGKKAARKNSSMLRLNKIHHVCHL